MTNNNNSTEAMNDIDLKLCSGGGTSTHLSNISNKADASFDAKVRSTEKDSDLINSGTIKSQKINDSDLENISGGAVTFEDL